MIYNIILNWKKYFLTKMKINISIIKYIRYFNLYNNIKLLKEIIIIELIIYKSLIIYLILILIMKVV